MMRFSDVRKQFRSRYIIITLTILTFIFYVFSAIVYILNTYKVLQAPWFIPLFAVFTGLGTTAGIPAAVWTFLQSLHAFSVRGSTGGTNANPAPLYRNIHGNPPLTNDVSIQQREKVVREVYAKLMQKGTTAVVLTGLAYVGKSTVAALVLHHGEKLRHQRIRHFFRVLLRRRCFTAEPLWIAVDDSTTMTDIAGTIFETFGEVLPTNFSNSPPHNQARKVSVFLRKAKKVRLIVIDQLVTALNIHTGAVLDSHLDMKDWLNALNSGTCKSPILFTSRIWPEGSLNHYPTHMKKHVVDVLEIKEGIALLRKRGVEGTEKELRAVVDYCNGHAHALDLLTRLLWHNRIQDLPTLLDTPIYAHLWKVEIAKLFDPVYKQQLERGHCELLLAFSVFREYVPLDVAAPIRDFTATMSQAQIFLALHTLLGLHLLIQDSGQQRYKVPVIIANYVEKHFSDGDEQANQLALHEAHRRAADYYEGLPLPAQRQSIKDLSYLLETIRQRCLAGQRPQAYDMLRAQNIFSDLRLWGENKTLQEIYQLLLPLSEWRPEPTQEALISHDLGAIYYDLGEKQEALRYYKLAVEGYRDILYWREEGEVLTRLGTICCELGQHRDACQYYESALSLYHGQGARRDEGYTYENLGEACYASNQKEQARGYYAQALAVFEEVGNTNVKCTTLNHMGTLSLERGNDRVALACFHLAAVYQQQTVMREEMRLLRKRIGKKRFKELLSAVEGRELPIIRDGFTEQV